MSSFDRGWDNDNFLESLGSAGDDNDNVNNNDAIERANDDYYNKSVYGRPPTTAVDENEEDDGSLYGNGGPTWFPANANDATATTSYAEYQQQRQEQEQEQVQQQQSPSFPPNNAPYDNNMATVSAAAMESYSYSYNNNVAAPVAPVSSNPAVTETTDSAEETPKAEDGFTEGASLSPEMVEKAKASHFDDKEETSQGGSRFRALIARAQDNQIMPQHQQNPLLADEGAITPASSIMSPEEIANLSIEAQARLYREFFFTQQQGKSSQQQNAKSIGSTASNYLEPGIGFDGRKIGRNRDSIALSNTGDVYFAQLKRDSTSRNIARYSGDDARANDVFHDPAIQEMKAPVNPYLEDQHKRQLDLITTVPEEMLIFQEFDPDNDGIERQNVDKSHSGISYRQKMQQKQEERQQQQNAANNDGGDNNNDGGINYNTNNNGNNYSY